MQNGLNLHWFPYKTLGRQGLNYSRCRYIQAITNNCILHSVKRIGCCMSFLSLWLNCYKKADWWCSYHRISVLPICFILPSHTEITSSPQSVNTLLNGVATFNCTFVGDEVFWSANGEKIFDGHDGYEFTVVQLTPPLVMSTLTVVTSLNKNNTIITCSVLSLDLSTINSSALLLLQGICTSIIIF